MNDDGKNNGKQILMTINIPKKWNPFILFIFLILLIIVVLIFANQLSIFNNSGQIGDYISGITTPILTFVAVIYAYRSFNKQREQLTYQIDDIKKERFRDTFFQLLNLQNNIIDNLKYGNELGRNIFKEIYNELIELYNIEIINKEKNKDEDYILKYCYLKLDDKHKDKLSHYYKNLYQIFSWIETNKDIDDKERADFVKFIRAQLSYYETHLLFFNANYFENRKYNRIDNENNRFYNMLLKYNFFKYDESPDESIKKIFYNNAKEKRLISKSASEEKTTTEIE